MLPPLSLNQDQIERLEKAKRLHKFGHLMSWKELFLYQCTIADREQIQIISNYAYRWNHGENIRLPLATFEAKQQELLSD